MDAIAETPEPPYYAVIFTSLRKPAPDDGYEATAARMVELAAGRPGFLGVETAREGLGITVSYWADEASIAAWKSAISTSARLVNQRKARRAIMQVSSRLL